MMELQTRCKTKFERFINLEAVQEQFDMMSSHLQYGEKITITAINAMSGIDEGIYIAWNEERFE